MTLEARLEDWIVARCHEKNPRPQRVAELNAIFARIYSDRRFWRYRNKDNCNYYEDALSLMWQYFLRNLCEATTARTSGSFLKTSSYAVGRLLTNLKGQLENNRPEPVPIPPINGNGDVIDPLKELPNPESELVVLQFEAFVHLLATDPTGELNDRSNTLSGKTKTTQESYTLTAQKYLLMRHRDDKTIKQIADELDIPPGTLQGRGKPTKWKALERKLARRAMDSVSQ